MKFIVSSLKLLKNLQALSGVIGTKNTLPILDDFLFQLTENELKITTSDLDVTMSVSMVPDMVEGTGEVTIPARLLLEIMKNFPDVPITINVDNNTLAVELIAGRFETESSGGITLDTIRDYALCGVDFVSVGALTHSVKGLDISFKTVK